MGTSAVAPPLSGSAAAPQRLVLPKHRFYRRFGPASPDTLLSDDKPAGIVSLTMGGWWDSQLTRFFDFCNLQILGRAAADVEALGAFPGNSLVTVKLIRRISPRLVFRMNHLLKRLALYRNI
jgi:hypothetical protein